MPFVVPGEDLRRVSLTILYETLVEQPNGEQEQILRPVSVNYGTTGTFAIRSASGVGRLRAG